MKDSVREVATRIGRWNGESAESHRTPWELAEEIDEFYQEHLVLPAKQNVAMQAGQREWERQVA